MSDYPTDDQLATIKEWPSDDPQGLVRFLHEIWHYPEGMKLSAAARRLAHDHGHSKSAMIRVRLATGGWSGNEEIIEALGKSTFWWLYWVSSHRGGLHIFDVPKEIWERRKQQ